MVRARRQERVYPPQLDEARAARSRVRRAAGNWHLQYLVGIDPVQYPLPRLGRKRQARRPRGGRFASGVSRHFAGRDDYAADDDAVSQPGEHGRRGVHPRQSRRWGGAIDRLRQDYAVLPDGCSQRRFADHRGVGRADAQRQIPWRKHRLGDRCLEVQRGFPRRQDVARGVSVGRDGDDALGRALHDHGYGLVDGQHGRGAGHDLSGRCGDPRARLAAQSAGAHGGNSHCGDGRRGSQNVEDPGARSL